MWHRSEMPTNTINLPGSRGPKPPCFDLRDRSGRPLGFQIWIRLTPLPPQQWNGNKSEAGLVFLNLLRGISRNNRISPIGPVRPLAAATPRLPATRHPGYQVGGNKPNKSERQFSPVNLLEGINRNNRISRIGFEKPGDPRHAVRRVGVKTSPMSYK